MTMKKNENLVMGKKKSILSITQHYV